MFSQTKLFLFLTPLLTLSATHPLAKRGKYSGGYATFYFPPEPGFCGQNIANSSFTAALDPYWWEDGRGGACGAQIDISCTAVTIPGQSGCPGPTIRVTVLDKCSICSDPLGRDMQLTSAAFGALTQHPTDYYIDGTVETTWSFV